jgi:hypothetical protein
VTREGHASRRGFRPIAWLAAILVIAGVGVAWRVLGGVVELGSRAVSHDESGSRGRTRAVPRASDPRRQELATPAPAASWAAADSDGADEVHFVVQGGDREVDGYALVTRKPGEQSREEIVAGRFSLERRDVNQV